VARASAAANGPVTERLTTADAAGGHSWPRAAIEAWAVLTRDGRPVHDVDDEQGQPVLDADGRPLIVAVEVPEGSSVEGPARTA
jgi:hypothetical protein